MANRRRKVVAETDDSALFACGVDPAEHLPHGERGLDECMDGQLDTARLRRRTDDVRAGMRRGRCLWLRFPHAPPRPRRPHALTPNASARRVVFDYAKPRRAAWPEADFTVGNPPFIGASRMREALGDGYTEALADIHESKSTHPHLTAKTRPPLTCRTVPPWLSHHGPTAEQIDASSRVVELRWPRTRRRRKARPHPLAQTGLPEPRQPVCHRRPLGCYRHPPKAPHQQSNINTHQSATNPARSPDSNLLFPSERRRPSVGRDGPPGRPC